MYQREKVHNAFAKGVIAACQAKVRPVHWQHTLMFDVNGRTGKMFRISNLHVYANFVANFTNEIVIEGYMDPRFYYENMVKHPDKIQCTLISKQYDESGRYFITSGKTLTNRYKGLLLDTPVPGLGNPNDQQKEVVNPDQSIVFVRLQLIDEKIYELRNASFSCMFNATVPFEALCMALDGVGSDYKVAGVNRPTEPNVTDKRMIVIPRGTRVKDIAHYVQKNYGIYNHGIGCYVHPWEDKNFWFVYPLFNSQRYQKEYYKLTVNVIDENYNHYEKGNAKRTYYVNQGETIMYIQSNTKTSKDRYEELNRETGVQFLNNDNLVDKTREDVSTNKVYKDGKTGVSSMEISKREDGIQNLKPVYEDTTNTANLYSQVIGNSGNYMQLEWRYGDISRLQPGMPIKVQYVGANGIETKYGTLHEYHAISGISQTSAVETAMDCHIMLNVYLDV